MACKGNRFKSVQNFSNCFKLPIWKIFLRAILRTNKTKNKLFEEDIICLTFIISNSTI